MEISAVRRWDLGLGIWDFDHECLDNVGAMLAEAFKMADLIRLELHGPANELDKLRKPLAHLNPMWFPVELERE